MVAKMKVETVRIGPKAERFVLPWSREMNACGQLRVCAAPV